jgi:hypothetical protein
MENPPYHVDKLLLLNLPHYAAQVVVHIPYLPKPCILSARERDQRNINGGKHFNPNLASLASHRAFFAALPCSFLYDPARVSCYRTESKGCILRQLGPLGLAGCGGINRVYVYAGGIVEGRSLRMQRKMYANSKEKGKKTHSLD